MNDTVNFVLAATALLGSPGPGIAALVAVGRSSGLLRGLPYLLAMQAGLAIAAGLSAVGLVALVAATPFLGTALTLASIAYLVWLAWSIASAPLKGSLTGTGENTRFRLSGGFLLGFANPKAYLAFASLFGSFALVDPAHGMRDTLLKWVILVGVMIVVDLAWLLVGVGLGNVRMSPRAERAMNVAMGATILLACAVTLIG